MSDFKKLTAEEVLAYLRENVDGHEFANEDFEYGDGTVLGNGDMVDEHGGYEGQGEDCHRVFYFSDHDVYIRIDGYYASYSGSEWSEDDYRIVRPVQRMVTFYE